MIARIAIMFAAGLALAACQSMPSEGPPSNPAGQAPVCDFRRDAKAIDQALTAIGAASDPAAEAKAQRALLAAVAARAGNPPAAADLPRQVDCLGAAARAYDALNSYAPGPDASRGLRAAVEQGAAACAALSPVQAAGQGRACAFFGLFAVAQESQDQARTLAAAAADPASTPDLPAWTAQLRTIERFAETLPDWGAAKGRFAASPNGTADAEAYLQRIACKADRAGISLAARQPVTVETREVRVAFAQAVDAAASAAAEQLALPIEPLDACAGTSPAETCRSKRRLALQAKCNAGAPQS